MSANQSDLIKYIASLNYAQNQVTLYACLIIGNIGFASNSLNILVCMRKKFRKETMGFYNPLISVFNILSLAMGYLSLYPVSIGNQNLELVSYYGCVLISYFGRVFVQMSSWLNVMVSLDRMISIKYLNTVNFIKQRKTLACIVGVLFTVICVINSPNLAFSVIRSQTNNQTLVCSCTNSVVVIIRDLIAQVMRTILPSLLDFVLNMILIHRLVQARYNINIKRSMKREYKFSFTIVMLNMTFFLTHTPLLISIIYLNVLNYGQSSASVPTKTLVMAYFLYIVAAVLASCMYGSVFFVNLLFNPNFRREFHKMITF